MTPTVFAVRLGLARGWTEFRNSLTSLQDVPLGPPMGLLLLAILLLSMNEPVEGAAMSVATLAMPGILGVMLAAGGIVSAAYWLAAEREDGTLLRAKAVPHGIAGYVTARIVTVSLDTLLGVLIVLVPGLFLFEGLAAGGAARWLTVAWVALLGLAATLPWGAIIGSLLKSPRAAGGLSWIPMMGFIVISGIFEPIQRLWDWVQWIAQVFPIYWLGLGMRSAFLPDSAVALEIGGSWRTWETVAVLGAWAVSGLLLAPVVLRRMARRESGASLAARRSAGAVADRMRRQSAP
jgi:ABC-2 type transport system permease protein